VYDYALGKVDWLANNLPSERAHAEPVRVAERMSEVPSAPVSETAETARRRARDVGWDICVVINDADIVMGALRVDDTANGTAEEVMRPGPATVRPNEPLEPTLERMRFRHVSSLLVSTPNGRLLGAIHAAP